LVKGLHEKITKDILSHNLNQSIKSKIVFFATVILFGLISSANIESETSTAKTTSIQEYFLSTEIFCIWGFTIIKINKIKIKIFKIIEEKFLKKFFILSEKFFGPKKFFAELKKEIFIATHSFQIFFLK
jgi:hypothetical protein